MDHLNWLYQFTIICMLAWSLTTTGVLLFAIEKLLVKYCTDNIRKDSGQRIAFEHIA